MTSLGQALYTASASKRYLSSGAALSPKSPPRIYSPQRRVGIYCVRGLRLTSVELSTKAAWGLTGGGVPKNSRAETYGVALSRGERTRRVPPTVVRLGIQATRLIVRLVGSWE